jgi:hypothetical protein
MIDQISKEFVWNNCSKEQQEMIKLKWQIFEYMQSYKGYNSEAYEELSEIVFKSPVRIRNIYENTKKAMQKKETIFRKDAVQFSGLDFDQECKFEFENSIEIVHKDNPTLVLGHISELEENKTEVKGYVRLSTFAQRYIKTMPQDAELMIIPKGVVMERIETITAFRLTGMVMGINYKKE